MDSNVEITLNNSEDESTDPNANNKTIAVETNENEQKVLVAAKEKMNEDKSAVLKDTIEILRVELVTPGREEHCTPHVVEDEILVNENLESAVNASVIEEKQQSMENNTKYDNENEESIVNTSAVEEKQQLKKNNIECVDNINENEFVMNTMEIELYDQQTKNNSESTLEPMNTTATSALSLLAQYDSENDDNISDTDSVIEIPTTSAKDYRNQVVEINSDSDSDDSDSDVEYLNELRKTIEKRTEVVANEDDEEEEDENVDENVGKKKHKSKLKVKGEMLLEDLPPIQDLQITVPEDQCIEFGKIHSIVNQLLLVSPLPNSILLDLETVIFLEKGQKVLGEVFDVLGQVADPLYCVRFNSNKHIKDKQINVGDIVYVAPKSQYTQYVILSSLMKLRGSDASWENDIEPPPRFLDYSDDEQEQLARRQLRNKDRPTDNDDPEKRPRLVEEENTAENSFSNKKKKSTYRNRFSGQSDRESENFNKNSRSSYNVSHQNQQRSPNYHRSSWHSNYYPQSFSQSATNYAMPSHNQAPSTQAFPSHVPMYPMATQHTMHCPPPFRYGPHRMPAIHQQQQPQFMPNSFSIRPPTLHGPHQSSHQQQYASPPPPGL